MDIEKRLEAIEKRLAVLENGRGLSDCKPKTLELGFKPFFNVHKNHVLAVGIQVKIVHKIVKKAKCL